MRILILSDTPWNKDNSFGNSFSNIFEGISNIEIANIYCKYGNTDCNIVKRSFQITEKSLIKNLLNKNLPSGIETNSFKAIELNITEEHTFNQVRKQRLQVYFWMRDLIWKIGRWKSSELKRFIDDFRPDLIFQPVYYSNYLSDIALFIKKYTNVPMLGYISDDCYTLKQFSLSPFYWIDRLYKRRKVKKVINNCEILYVISDIQKKEYEKIFNTPCKVLTKGAKFGEERPVYKSTNENIRLLYAGNLSAGRQKTLSLISKTIANFNRNGVLITLDIYSASPIKKQNLKIFNENGCKFHGSVSYNEILNIQKECDLLIHIEGMSLKERCAVHQSFSTKIVDFFEMAKPILAVGPKDVASMDYLIRNDAAITATSEKELEEKLRMIIENPKIIKEYGDKAWDCGKRNHQIDNIQKMLKDDFENLIEKKI